MSDSTRAFRDYATRVSFNLSLSRNQVGHLAAVVLETENDLSQMKFMERMKRKDDAIVESGGRPPLFVFGYGSLERMGLIEHDPRWIQANEDKTPGAYWKYTGPSHQLTEAGRHVVELLRIAGLIPKAAANDKHKRKRNAAA